MRPVVVVCLGLALYAGAVAVFSLADSAPAWPPERGSGARVVDAVVAWAAQCARSRSAGAANCPQRGSDPAGVRSTEFRWRAGRPLLLYASVRWLEPIGAFEVRGAVNMDVEHDRVLPGGRSVRFAGNFETPFVVVARRTGDRRDFGAYRWTDAAPALGFAIRYLGPWWSWQCCATAKEVVIP